MQLTENFSKKEFDSKDGSAMPLEVLDNVCILAKQLQVLRDVLETTITINSGYRSVKHNKREKGTKNSQHLQGKAADIVCKGYSPKNVSIIIEKLIKDGKMLQGGLGIYNSFIHYDIRGVKARWDFRK